MILVRNFLDDTHDNFFIFYFTTMQLGDRDLNPGPPYKNKKQAISVEFKGSWHT